MRVLAVAALAAFGIALAAPDAAAAPAGSLSVQGTRSLEPYVVTGTSITGAAGPSKAPVLEPGQYRDTLVNSGDDSGRDGPRKYYEVELAKGETPYFTATVVPPSAPGEGDDQLLVTVQLTDGKADASCEIEQYEQSYSIQGKLMTTTAVLAPGEVGGDDWPTNCPTSGQFFVEVNRNFGGDAPLPVELAYRSEPAADVFGVPGPATDPTSRPLPTPSADVTELAGGSSYDSAPELTSGTTYSDAIVFGEDRYFKVHLDWGQQFAFRFDVVALDDLGVLDGVQSKVFAANPVRQELGDIRSQSDTSDPFLGSSVAELAGSTTVPARWTNRQSSSSDIEDYGLDGDYYLVLTAGFDDDRTSTTVPYTVTVEVTGSKEAGPKYAQGADSSSTDGTGPNGGAGNGASGNDASGSASWTTGRTTLVGGSIGIAVLAAIVLGWLVLGRRRTARPATPPIMPPPGGSDWS